MGDASLYVPTGNVVGIFWALVAAFVARTGWNTRVLALGLAAVAVALPYLAPGAWLEAWLRISVDREHADRRIVNSRIGPS